MEKGKYEKLLKENITKTYKISSKQKINHINYAAKKIVDLDIADRVELMEEAESYITLKDHKSFLTKPLVA